MAFMPESLVKIQFLKENVIDKEAWKQKCNKLQTACKNNTVVLLLLLWLLADLSIRAAKNFAAQEKKNLTDTMKQIMRP